MNDPKPQNLTVFAADLADPRARAAAVRGAPKGAAPRGAVKTSDVTRVRRMAVAAASGDEDGGLRGALPQVRFAQSVVATALRERRVLTWIDVLADPDAPAQLRDAAHRWGRGFSAAVASMTHSGGGTTASLLLVRQAGRAWSQAEADLLQTLGQQSVVMAVGEEGVVTPGRRRQLRSSHVVRADRKSVV